MPNVKADSSAPAARYVENKAACLILASISSHSGNKAMQLVLAIEVSRSNGIQGKTQGKDLIYLIRIHKRDTEFPKNESTLYIQMCLSPYYLITMDWDTPNGIRSDTVKAFDVCYEYITCKRFRNI